MPNLKEKVAKGAVWTLKGKTRSVGLTGLTEKYTICVVR